MRGILVFLAVLALCGCGRAPLKPEADRQARGFFEAVRAGDWTTVDAQLGPSMAAIPNRQATFEAVRASLPTGAPREAREVGWAEKDGAVSAVHLYRFADSDVVVSTALQNGKVAGFLANRLPPAAIEANRFTLGGKTPRHYGFLISAVLSPLAMLGMALLAAATKELRWRYAWAALALVGVGKAWLNWTTGQGGFEWAQVGLLGAGVTRATDISPWVLSFAAPVGALIVLARIATVKSKA